MDGKHRRVADTTRWCGSVWGGGPEHDGLNLQVAADIEAIVSAFTPGREHPPATKPQLTGHFHFAFFRGK